MVTHSALALLALAAAAGATCPLNGPFDPSVDLFASKASANHAAGWGVRYRNFYKEVRAGGTTYQLVHCNADAAEFAKMEAALPACGAQCKRMTVPVERAAVLGNEAVGFLEELELLDSVKLVGSPAVSACLASKEPATLAGASLTDEELAGVDAVFATTAGAGDSGKHVDMAGLDAEASPLGKQEWVEFVSLFYNAEGMANYVVYRSQEGYNASAHLARAQGAASVMWVTKATATEVTLTSDRWVKALLGAANAEAALFGRVVAIDGAEYHDALKAADAIVVTDGVRYGDAGALLAALGVSLADKAAYKALNYEEASAFRLYEVDRFTTAGAAAAGYLGNDWEEHVWAAPDVLLSDLMKATRGAAAPWASAPWVYLRAAADAPVAVAPRPGAECGRDVYGAARPASLKAVRLAVLGGLAQAEGNPTAAIENYAPHTDYFPDKIDPAHAVDFDVEYHLTWKLVRDNRQGFAYVLLLKGVPASALPSADVLPAAKRFRVPVAKVGFSSTTTAPLLLSLGQAGTIKVAAATPESCILQGLADGRIVDYNAAAAADFKDLDVLYTSVNAWSPPWSVHEANGVNVQSTSDPGALNRAEWLMFTAAFHNAEKVAEATFAEMKAKYECAQEKGQRASAAAGRRPAFVEITNVWGTPGMFQSPQTPYHMELIEAAGGNPAAADPAHPFQQAGTVEQGWSGAVTRFTQEELLEALKHADVVVDNHWSASSTASTPMGWAEIKEFYGFPDDMSAYPWFQTQSLYRLDKRMAANGFTEQFVRFTTEPDAVLMDFMGALHPEEKTAPTYFFRNILTGDAVIEPKAELCVDYTAVEPPLTTQGGACEIPTPVPTPVPTTTTPVPTPVPTTATPVACKNTDEQYCSYESFCKYGDYAADCPALCGACPEPTPAPLCADLKGPEYCQRNSHLCVHADFRGTCPATCDACPEPEPVWWPAFASRACRPGTPARAAELKKDAFATREACCEAHRGRMAFGFCMSRPWGAVAGAPAEPTPVPTTAAPATDGEPVWWPAFASRACRPGTPARAAELKKDAFATREACCEAHRGRMAFGACMSREWATVAGQ